MSAFEIFNTLAVLVLLPLMSWCLGLVGFLCWIMLAATIGVMTFAPKWLYKVLNPVFSDFSFSNVLNWLHNLPLVAGIPIVIFCLLVLGATMQPVSKGPYGRDDSHPSFEGFLALFFAFVVVLGWL